MKKKKVGSCRTWSQTHITLHTACWYIVLHCSECTWIKTKKNKKQLPLIILCRIGRFYRTRHEKKISTQNEQIWNDFRCVEEKKTTKMTLTRDTISLCDGEQLQYSSQILPTIKRKTASFRKEDWNIHIILCSAYTKYRVINRHFRDNGSFTKKAHTSSDSRTGFFDIDLPIHNF